MKQYQTQKGFTLVELAIVMTIIGLLIGGILKGQELMENARVTSTVAQVKAYEAAVTTFRDSYSALPGDMPNAERRIPNCTVDSCETDPATQTFIGDSVVGASDWADTWAAQVTGALNGATITVGGETQMFWTHMLLADLISGVTDAPLRTDGTLGWGESHPAARIGGGFVVGFGNGSYGLGATEASLPANGGPSGLIIAVVNAIQTTPGVTAGNQPLTAARAAQIDRRIDDGRPASGYVQGYGTADSCFGPDAAAPIYIEANTGRNCGLIFRIQG